MLKTDGVCDYSDSQAFGAEYRGPEKQDFARDWVTNERRGTDEGVPSIYFHDAKDHADDPLHVNYMLAWGPPSNYGVDTDEPENEILECCDTILTRIRCWVELVPLKD